LISENDRKSKNCQMIRNNLSTTTIRTNIDKFGLNVKYWIENLWKSLLTEIWNVALLKGTQL